MAVIPASGLFHPGIVLREKTIPVGVHTMEIFGSFNHGNPVIGLLLMPFFLAMPWVMLWIETRSVFKGEALSRTWFVVLFLCEIYALYLAWHGIFRELALILGYWRIWSWALLVATSAAPFILAFEAYKQGWFNRLLYPPKKKKRKATPTS